MPCLWIRGINIFKMSLLPKAIYRSNTIQIKIQIVLFTEGKQILLKFIWDHRRSQIANVIFFPGLEDAFFNFLFKLN